MDFDDFIQDISGSRPPHEVDIDEEVMDLMDAAYKQYERGGRGGATVTQKGKTFEEWLGSNPIGLHYLKKIIANLKKNKKRRCPDCDGNGQIYSRNGYYDCPRCQTSGIVKEAIEASVDPSLQSIVDHARDEYEYWIKTFCDDKEDPPTFEVWLGRTALGRQFIKQIISKTLNNAYQLESRLSESFSRDEVPTQEEVRRFLERYHNELHYLYELDPAIWDEYDLSNWRSLVRRKGRYGWHDNISEDRMHDNPYSKFLNTKPTPVSTADEEKTCPICNGDCEVDGKECSKCQGTGTVYKGVKKESLVSESGGDFYNKELGGWTLTGWYENRGQDTPSGQCVYFWINYYDEENDRHSEIVWWSNEYDPCDESEEWDDSKVDHLIAKAEDRLRNYATGRIKTKLKWEESVNMKTKFKFNQLADQLCESLADQPIFVHARSAYNKMARIKNAVLTSATTIRLQMEDNTSVDMSLTDSNHNYQLVLNDGQFVTARDVARIFGLLEPDQIVSEDTTVGYKDLIAKYKEYKRTAAKPMSFITWGKKRGYSAEKLAALKHHKAMKESVVSEDSARIKKKLNEGTRYGRGFPYRLDFVKNDKVVGSKVIKSRDDLEHHRHWIAQQDAQGNKLKKRTIRGTVSESTDIPTHWRNNIPMTRSERQSIAKLRKAGCRCELPLLGERPDNDRSFPRCRLCNAEYYPE